MSNSSALLQRLQTLAKSMESRGSESGTQQAASAKKSMVLQETFINRVNEEAKTIGAKHAIHRNGENEPQRRGNRAPARQGSRDAIDLNGSVATQDDPRAVSLASSHRSIADDMLPTGRRSNSFKDPHTSACGSGRSRAVLPQADPSCPSSLATSPPETSHIHDDSTLQGDAPQMSSIDQSATVPGSRDSATPAGIMSNDSIDGSQYDGVKTTVLWSSTDPSFFNDCQDAIYEPEGVDVMSDDELDAYVVPSFPLSGGIELHELRQLIAKARSAPPMKPTGESPLTLKDVMKEPNRMSIDAPDPQFVEIDGSVRFNRTHACESRRPHVRHSLGGHQDARYNSIQLNVIYEPYKTGFEDEKEFSLEPGRIVAGRYEIIDVLGQGTFCRVVRCYDLKTVIDDGEGTPTDGENAKQVEHAQVCLKFVNNSKDFFDQSLDEIKLLSLLNEHADPEEVHIVALMDYFYYKEHMVLVTELLSDNLYEYQKFNREHEDGDYFTLPRLQKIAKQMTEALAYVHSLNLIHCDLKPENVLFRSHRRCEVKVIDFGSSCFTSDHLSTYIQSRSYRAPEVILGCDYDGGIDVWSLGAIMVEMVTADVLFSSETVAEMLARIVAVTGTPFPRHMLYEGTNAHHFMNRFGAIFEKGAPEDDQSEACLYVYTPIHTSFDSNGVEVKPGTTHQNMINKLSAAGIDDPLFIDFCAQCLTVDNKTRPTSNQLLNHKFLSTSYE